MWVYGDPIELPNRQRLRCKLCGKEIFGGVNHLKYHLAKISGYDVDACLKTTLKIMHVVNQSLLDLAKKRDEKEELRNELATRGSMGTRSASRVGVGELQSHASSLQPTTSGIRSSTSPFFVPRSTPGGNLLFDH